MYYDTDDMVPLDHIKVANEMAAKFALDAPIRRAAARILAGCRNIPQSGPRQIALWLRKHVTYQQEAPGVEILQGPYHTLRFGVGDCDDLALTMACLCRAAGIKAYVCGVARAPKVSHFIHAVCFVPGVGHFEISSDENYGGIGHLSERFKHGKGIATVYYDPEPRGMGYYLSTGKHYTRVTRNVLEERAVIMGHNRGIAMGVAPWQMGACPSCLGMGKTAKTDGGGGGGGGSSPSALDWFREAASVAPDLISVFGGGGGGGGGSDDVSIPPIDMTAQRQPIPSWVWFVGVLAIGGVVLMVAKS